MTAIADNNPDGRTALEPAVAERIEYARKALANGRDRQWAGALWAAGEQAIRDLGKARGIGSRDIIAIAESLDAQDAGQRERHFSSALGNVYMLRAHCQLGALESYWWADLHDDTVAFIQECYAAA